MQCGALEAGRARKQCCYLEGGRQRLKPQQQAIETIECRGAHRQGGAGGPWALSLPPSVPATGTVGRKRRMHRCMPRAELQGRASPRFLCRCMAGSASSTRAAPPPRPQFGRQAFTLKGPPPSSHCQLKVLLLPQS